MRFTPRGRSRKLQRTGSRPSARGTSVCWATQMVMRLPITAGQSGGRAPDTEFNIRALEALPRVDIVYAYTGSDGTAVRAFVEAGAQGIVSAGFAPGFSGPGDVESLEEAVRRGVVVVQSTRAGSGRTFKSTRLTKSGFLIADNLNPQKARLLLALALTVTREGEEIARIFAEY